MPISRQIADLYSKLHKDTYRKNIIFSIDMQAANAELLAAASEREAAETLSKWLHRFQPCLFGRISAKLGRIQYCILSERDLLGDDDSIKTKIQEARAEWTRDGFLGQKSGFVILALSEKLSEAAPDLAMNQFAQRLCSLYLDEESIANDIIYTDEVFLEKPGKERMTWKWLAGVNFFAAAADGRWWQDHRIPGGLGFSINSVGHLVKTGVLQQELNEALLAGEEPLASSKIDSLKKALEFAMRTIWNASDAISGKATELLPLGDQNLLPTAKCPTNLPHFLESKNYCTYQGFYNTDVTLPKDYFLPDFQRPKRIRPLNLDFTYLFQDDIGNPAHITMGKGRRVRGSDHPRYESAHKLAKAEPNVVRVSSSPRLLAALSR